MRALQGPQVLDTKIHAVEIHGICKELSFCSHIKQEARSSYVHDW